MTANSKLREAMYWISVDSWHRINKDGQFELTEEAPERAVKSFECSAKSIISSRIKASRTEVLFSYPD